MDYSIMKIYNIPVTQVCNFLKVTEENCWKKLVGIGFTRKPSSWVGLSLKEKLNLNSTN